MNEMSHMNRSQNFKFSSNKSSRRGLKQPGRDPSKDHLSSYKTLDHQASKSLHRDKTIDTFDVVEPTAQNSFGVYDQTLTSRPSAQRSKRVRLRSGGMPKFKHYFKNL